MPRKKTKPKRNASYLFPFPSSNLSRKKLVIITGAFVIVGSIFGLYKTFAATPALLVTHQYYELEHQSGTTSIIPDTGSTKRNNPYVWELGYNSVVTTTFYNKVPRITKPTHVQACAAVRRASPGTSSVFIGVVHNFLGKNLGNSTEHHSVPHKTTYTRICTNFIEVKPGFQGAFFSYVQHASSSKLYVHSMSLECYCTSY